MIADRDRQALEDILQAIEAIRSYTPASREEFETFEPYQSHYIRYLIQIGESATRVSPEFKERHPELPWREMIGMRNILAHDYEKIDPDELWRTAERDLPNLRNLLIRVLETTA